MGWRTLIVNSAAKLSTSNNQLLVSSGEDAKFPIEDIDAIVVENHQTTITSALLNKIADENVVLYICDEFHIPSGVFIPFNKHSRQSKIVKRQISLSKPFIKRCWQQIVIQKIENQAKCLELSEVKEFDEIRILSKEVLSGDETNKEAHAAKIYFRKLFGNFTRRDNDPINAALNYGYAILRGAIARTISAYGFIPSIGLKHTSELNQFNLADDFIEPFRPLVDLWVAQNMTNEEHFEKEHKYKLVTLLNNNIMIKNEYHSASNAIDVMISSFSSACNNENYKLLLLPKLIPIELHKYE